MAHALPWSRTELLRWLRLEQIGEALSRLTYDLPVGTNWEGNGRRGVFRIHNGSGDDAVVVWEPGKLIAVAFDHESSRSVIANEELDREAEEPRANFEPPAEWDALLERAAELLEYGDDQNVTAGLWGEDERLLASEPLEDALEHGLHMIQPFEAGELAYLTRKRSLTEPMARLALALVERSEAGASALAPEEARLFAGNRTGAAGQRIARTLLEQLWIRWP